MEFKDLLAQRRSCRAYLKTPVSREDVAELIQSARRAPVSCNLQVTQFIVVDDPVLLGRLTKEVGSKFAYSPCCIVVVQDPRITVVHESATMTTGMMVENMILRAEELGLATCPMAGFTHDERIKTILGIPKPLSVMLLLAVGYPDKSVSQAPLTKINIDDLYSYNGYGGMHFLNVSAKLDDYTIAELVDYRHRIAPVYLDRWRLATASPDMYAAAGSFISSRCPEAGNLLDLVSYDGEFLKWFHEHKPEWRLTASDYHPITTDFLQKALGCDAAKLTFENKIEPVGCKPTMISLVYKAEFTPQCNVLVQSAADLLDTDGLLFVAVYHEVLLKRVVRTVRNWINYVRNNRPINIYEQNPFYRIGPYKAPRISTCKKWFADAGLELVAFEQTPVGKRKNFARFYLAKKLPIAQ